MIGKTNPKSPESGSDGSPRTRYLYPVPEVAEKLGGITDRYVWKLVETGALRSVKIGRRRLIPHDALAEYLASLNVPCPDPVEPAAATTAA